jgi:nucleoside-diphosphate-sugar epimerase
MRFFVTGATGFIGGHLVERLVSDGHTVTALVRSPAKASRLLELGARLLPGDLSVFADRAFVLDEVDIVVHLAGVVTAYDPDEYEAINYTAVVDLMRCLQRQTWRPSRLLFASSLAAAGSNPRGRPWSEADPVAPMDPYGKAKARAEVALRDAGFPVTCFRPPLVFGAGDPAFLTLFKPASRGLGLSVAGPPQRLSWIYVDDLVDAMLTLAGDDRPESFTYFTTAEDTMDTDRLWDALRSAFGRTILVLPVPGPLLGIAASISGAVAPLLGLRNQLDHKQVAQMRAPRFECTSQTLTRDLGWSAQVSFEDAIRRTAEGYSALGWL